MCTFQYPFSRKFFNWRKFRSKPRCKIIVTGGGVVQVGRKRAPQGTFHRNFTPPHERRELNRTNFSSSGERFFACRKSCTKFRAKFHENFLIFFEKNPPQGKYFSMIFLTFEEAIFRSFFRSFFRVIFGVFFRGFS